MVTLQLRTAVSDAAVIDGPDVAAFAVRETTPAAAPKPRLLDRVREPSERVTTAAAPTRPKAFITADLVQRRKLIRKAQQHEHTNLAELRAAATKTLVEKLDAQIQEAEAQSLAAERLAQLAGMHDWYPTVYAMLSMDHTQRGPRTGVLPLARC